MKQPKRRVNGNMKRVTLGEVNRLVNRAMRLITAKDRRARRRMLQQQGSVLSYSRRLMENVEKELKLDWMDAVGVIPKDHKLAERGVLDYYRMLYHLIERIRR